MASRGAAGGGRERAWRTGATKARRSGAWWNRDSGLGHGVVVGMDGVDVQRVRIRGGGGCKEGNLWRRAVAVSHNGTRLPTNGATERLKQPARWRPGDRCRSAQPAAARAAGPHRSAREPPRAVCSKRTLLQICWAGLGPPRGWTGRRVIT